VSHRDLADLGTHLSPENRDSYVRDADVHLSLWSFRDSNNSPGTLPARGGFVNNASPPPRSRGPDKILPAKGARRITHLSDFWKALGEAPAPGPRPGSSVRTAPRSRRGPAAFADQMLPHREVAPRPDPVGRTLDGPAFGEPTVPGDALDGDPKGLALPQRSRCFPTRAGR
jgi:hypothetical protein